MSKMSMAKSVAKRFQAALWAPYTIVKTWLCVDAMVKCVHDPVSGKKLLTVNNKEVYSDSRLMDLEDDFEYEFEVNSEKAKLTIKKVGANGFAYELRVGDVPVLDTTEAEADVTIKKCEIVGHLIYEEYRNAKMTWLGKSKHAIFKLKITKELSNGEVFEYENRKRYSEFLELDDNLRRTIADKPHLTSSCPKLPPKDVSKSIMQKSLTEEFLNDRGMMLTTYLKNLRQFKQLQGAPCLVAFLDPDAVTDHKRLQNAIENAKGKSSSGSRGESDDEAKKDESSDDDDEEHDPDI